jgi:GntR family transcriptional regulator
MSQQSSLSQRLQDSLRSLIEETEPGERLPSEPQLARELGVSRATLREAMRTFETQGLIFRRQGSGTYVLHPAHVLDSGLEILESIETMAERIGLTVSMAKLDIEYCDPDKNETQSLGIEPDQKIVKLTRVIQAEGRPVAYLVDIVPGDILQPNDLGEDFSGSVLDFLLQRGDHDLRTSRCEINADTADPPVARALGIQRGDVLLRFVAYLYSSTGRIIDYSFSYFLPGYFRFHVVRRVG